MRNHRQLTFRERIYLELMREESMSQKQMSARMGRGIDERPEVINQRARIGDWERDLMFGEAADRPF